MKAPRKPLSQKPANLRAASVVTAPVVGYRRPRRANGKRYAHRAAYLRDAVERNYSS